MFVLQVNRVHLDFMLILKHYKTRTRTSYGLDYVKKKNEMNGLLFNQIVYLCIYANYYIKIPLVNMIRKINNADLFSQPPLLIFTKGANISGGHCI